MGSLGSFGVVAFTRVHHVGCYVHPGSLGSLEFSLGVVGFIRGHWVHEFALPVVGVAAFTRVRHRDHWVHPGS